MNAGSLDALQTVIASGEMQAIRSALLSLNQEEQRALEWRLGEVQTARLYKSIRTRSRAAPHGRVIVIHGIMGGQLDSVKNSDADRVWLNYLRLLNGRISDFRLTPDGAAADPRYTIRVHGMFPEYLPLLTELGEQWTVLPFAFDWRLSIDDSATKLARQVEDWSKGEPTHIVAHSMGGLVSRRFIQLFPALWKGMQDDTNKGRGGRLVMLGTPNKGSFAIPLILSGEEKTVKKLEKLDFHHNMSELLDIINTFPGSYQMMPSPDVNSNDDHARLYDIKTWGAFPVVDKHLQAGRAFQQSLTTVTDADRLLYIAGYDQETPHRIRVDGPGKFLYQTTREGDGRVPHEFGLLEGVRTFYVREIHGDLVRNEAVLSSIHELLLEGTTGALEVVPASRSIDRSANRAAQQWKRPEEIEIPRAEEWSILTQPFARGTTGQAKSPAEASQIESVLISEYIGTAQGITRGTMKARQDGSGQSTPHARRRPEPRLAVDVVWGDITKVAADVYVTGHYEHVAPIGAELALDRLVSGHENERNNPDAPELLLTALTRRGILSGHLGHVQFFPWASNSKRSVAIAGMGYPGSFGRMELRHLARNLTYAVGSLPNADSVCTVLIGSGEGSVLNTKMAASGLILGMLEALSSMSLSLRVRSLRIVERDYGKAAEILRAIKQIKAGNDALAELEVLDVADELVYGEGGAFGMQESLSLALQSTIRASRNEASAKERAALKVLLEQIPELKLGFRNRTIVELINASKRTSSNLINDALRLNLKFGENEDARVDKTATRISYVHDGVAICAAAITNTAVVPERLLTFDITLLDEAIVRMTDPEQADVADLSAFLTRLIVPREFRELLGEDKPVVFEVDRSMARVHWEMLAYNVDEDTSGRPVALERALARQLRTQYSPSPSADFRTPAPLRALVVGDPGDPDLGYNLPGAQEEAFAVAEVLEQKGVQVKLMVGAPGAARNGRLKFVAAASRLDVLSELMRGGYDLLHYAGHGDFDVKRPDTAGWLFKGGLITARELERMDVPPRLVVANACLSALTATKEGNARTAAILPSLADEFFKRGVRDYIGTAWEVNDEGAVEFAKALYDRIIPDAVSGTPGAPIGEAMLAARRVLYDAATKYGALWAAYQHYGDPSQTLNVAATAPDDVAPVAKKSVVRKKRAGHKVSAAKKTGAAATSKPRPRKSASKRKTPKRTNNS